VPPGAVSRWEAFTNEFFSPDSSARREEQTDLYRAAAVKLGGKDITESGNLLYEEERTEVVDWLRVHGWTIAAATSADDLMAAKDRAVPAGLDAAVPESVFVEGRLQRVISEAS
jgi:O-methyltransferase involved in polyketide biosynthesis